MFLYIINHTFSFTVELTPNRVNFCHIPYKRIKWFKFSQKDVKYDWVLSCNMEKFILKCTFYKLMK